MPNVTLGTTPRIETLRMSKIRVKSKTITIYLRLCHFKTDQSQLESIKTVKKNYQNEEHKYSEVCWLEFTFEQFEHGQMTLH
jgi:hypothetical protein